MARVVGIGGFFFRAGDPDRLSAWYAENLDVPGPPDSYDAPVWTQAAGPTVFAPFGDDGPNEHLGPSGWGLNLRVDDLDGVVARLRDAGVDVAVDPETYPNGRFAGLHDPEGNPVQLWQVAEPSTRVTSAVATLVARLRELLVDRHHPLLVGIDGRSAVGKSTLAATVSRALAEARDGTDHVTVIEGDDFYSGGSAEVWDHRSAAENAGLVIDWRRQRDVLEQLLESGIAQWLPFDWDADAWDGEVPAHASAPTVARATSVIVLDGAYSCRPELHDLLDLRVLLEGPSDVRRRRLLDREGNAYRADWDARWSAAEEYYFGVVMPPERFDLVLGIS